MFKLDVGFVAGGIKYYPSPNHNLNYVLYKTNPTTK